MHSRRIPWVYLAICKSCPDRRVDGKCGREADGSKPVPSLLFFVFRIGCFGVLWYVFCVRVCCVWCSVLCVLRFVLCVTRSVLSDVLCFVSAPP